MGLRLRVEMLVANGGGWARWWREGSRERNDQGRPVLVLQGDEVLVVQGGAGLRPGRGKAGHSHGLGCVEPGSTGFSRVQRVSAGSSWGQRCCELRPHQPHHPSKGASDSQRNEALNGGWCWLSTAVAGRTCTPARAITGIPTREITDIPAPAISDAPTHALTRPPALVIAGAPALPIKRAPARRSRRAKARRCSEGPRLTKPPAVAFACRAKGCGPSKGRSAAAGDGWQQRRWPRPRCPSWSPPRSPA